MIPGIIRLALCFLAIAYSNCIRFYLFLYKIGVRKSAKLGVPILCVGNLTTGGTGKTPTTISVCKAALALGKKPVVILRGYGGANEYGCAVVSDGKNRLLDVAASGDEAQLLAKALPGVPVVVGKDRIRSGKLAIERFHPDVIVMDDGFQHWRLHRDLNIVLLNSTLPFDNGWTLPRGMLREPKKGLERAGVVLLTNSRRAGKEQTESVKREAKQLAPMSLVFASDLIVSGVRELGGDPFPLEKLRGAKVSALSAIGNPASFENSLLELGVSLISSVRLQDHDALTEGDLRAALSDAQSCGAEFCVITEKDAVKFPEFRSALPILVLQVEMKIDDESEFQRRLQSVFEVRNQK